MEQAFKNRFSDLWSRFFPNAELPLAFYYADSASRVEKVTTPKGHRCLFSELFKARKGKALCFDNDGIGCMGGKRYLGFEQKVSPGFEFFLSCGIPGKVTGIRHKKTPDLVKALEREQPAFTAPASLIVFKPWEILTAEDDPLVIVFFVTPDALSGLFSLANFEQPDPFGVIAPSCASCAAIVQYPYHELQTGTFRAVLGMFDISARPYVSSNLLTLAIPWPRFEQMVENMEESVLITQEWQKVQSRMK